MGRGANPTAGVIGFQGNGDLYGIGIRIGYYTAALSIWISNLWAPTEVYFLRPITLTFLVALLIGVAVYSRKPENVFAIEPFMMMQVAYDTFNMGLYGPPAPELLVWERKYFTDFTTTFIALALHGYDMWFWFDGKSKMKKTPGDGTTMGLFMNFGQQDLFSWIEWPVKTYLCAAVTGITIAMLSLADFRRQQKTMDVLVPPERLEQLAERWTTDMGMNLGKDDKMDTGVLLSPGRAALSRNPSSASKRSSQSAAPSLSLGLDPGKDEITPSIKAHDKNSNESCDNCSICDRASSPLPKKPALQATIQRTSSMESEPKPLVRTMSERLRYHILGWKPDSTSPLPISKPPAYTPSPSSYTPNLETLIAANELLEAVNLKIIPLPRIRNWAIPFLPFIAWWVSIKYMNDMAISFVQLIPALFKYGIRPKVLLAVMSYGNTLRWERCVCWSRLLLRTVRHPNYSSVNEHDIALASRIMLSLHPLGKPNRTIVLFWAWLNFCFCSLLVIGTELAIQWNNITGVQSISSVGQLIPAAIGVGGLIKVIYTAVYEKDAEIDLCFGRCHGILRKARWKEASETYERAAIEWQRRREVETPIDEKGASKGEEKKKKDNSEGV